MGKVRQEKEEEWARLEIRKVRKEEGEKGERV